MGKTLPKIGNSKPVYYQENGLKRFLVPFASYCILFSRICVKPLQKYLTEEMILLSI